MSDLTQVTARFFVAEVNKRSSGYNAVLLMPAYKDGANATWAKATPSGKIELQVDGSLPASEWFEDMIGKNVAITFEAADE